MAWGTPDPTAPDPGPQPEEEHLTYEQLIAKYAPELKDDEIRETLLNEMVKQRKADIANDRAAKANKAIEDAWMTAYVKRYGTDEG